MTIEEVINKLRNYSNSEVFNAREAGKREAYEHALFLLEAVTPKEAECKTITVEGINNTWIMEPTTLGLSPTVKKLKKLAEEEFLAGLDEIVERR